MAAPLMQKVYSRCFLCGNYQRFKIGIRHHKHNYSGEATQTKPSEANQKWQPVIGLEIHAQIQAESKLFSRSAASYGAPVNTQVHFLDMALPGTLPVLNKRCVEAGVLTALALKCRINKVSRFDRKHYFYADLPANRADPDQTAPAGAGGSGSSLFAKVLKGVTIRTHADCFEKTAHIAQLQLEQDSGKSLHDDEDNQSLIDLNRAGCALMEIVTEPEFHNALEARSFVRDLRRALMLIGTCDGEMGESSIRVDVNISVHKKGEPLGIRAEVKNLNSLNAVQRSIEFEIKRQIKVLEGGGQVVNETRSFDRETNQTVPMRDKEVKQDYRFMPEPNLPPLHVFRSAKSAPSDNAPKVIIEDLQNQMPELPSELRQLLMSEYDCSLFQAGFLVNEGVHEYFMGLAKELNSKGFRNFFIYHYVNNLIMLEVEPDSSKIPPDTIATLYGMYLEGDVGQSSMSKVIELLLKNPAHDPVKLVLENDLMMIKDEAVIREICEQVLSSPEAKQAIKKYKKGNTAIALRKFVFLASNICDRKIHSYKLYSMFEELLTEKTCDS